MPRSVQRAQESINTTIALGRETKKRKLNIGLANSRWWLRGGGLAKCVVGDIARGQWTDGRKALTAYTAQGVIQYQEHELNEALFRGIARS